MVFGVVGGMCVWCGRLCMGCLGVIARMGGLEKERREGIFFGWFGVVGMLCSFGPENNDWNVAIGVV